MSASSVHGRPSSRPRSDLPLLLVSAVVGLATAPFAVIYIAALGLLVGGVAWGISRRRPEGAGGRVAVAAASIVCGTIIYVVLALVAGVFGSAPSTGSGSGSVAPGATPS